MPGENKALTVPLAIVTGVALGTNPNFQPLLVLTGAAGCPNGVCQPPGTAPGTPVQAVMLPARRGAESPELRALRLAEDGLFPEMAREEPDLGPLSMVDPPVACDLPSAAMPPNRSFAATTRDDFLRGLNQPTLPVRRHPRVKKYVEYFSKDAKGRKLFAAWLKRSGQYRGVIAKHLGQSKLPSDLEAVVFIESGFWPTAVSHAGATGLWQFMPKTARAYGLTVSPQYDERRSIWKATEAAVEHLGDLYSRLQNWDLALAAYNYGYQNVEKRISALGTDDYWTLGEIEGGLPRETALYVPKILAVAVILNNLEAFGFDSVELDPPLEAAEIEAPPGVPLSVIARAAGTSVTKLRQYNPELRASATPDLGSPVILRIPSKGYARARVMLPRLLGDEQDRLDLTVSPDFDWGRDDIGPSGRSRLERAGSDDPFGLNAAAAETELPPEVSPLGAVVPERGRGFDRLRATHEAPQGLNRPVIAPAEPTATPVEADASTALRQRVLYRVLPGDTVSRIARAFGISQRRVALDNSLSNPSLVRTGQLLRLTVPAGHRQLSHKVYYRVREDDTVDKIARRFGIDAGRLVADNELTDSEKLADGRLLLLRPN
jgi:membrane-bound lytic murein transglycosylase D